MTSLNIIHNQYMITKTYKKVTKYLKISKKIMRLYSNANGYRYWIMLIGIIYISLTPLGYSYIIKLIIDLITEYIKLSTVDLEPFIYLMIGLILIGFSSRFAWRIIEYYEKLNFLEFKKYLDMLVDTKFSSLGFEHYSDPKTNDLLNRVKDTYSYNPINFANRQLWILQNTIETISDTLVIIGLNFWIFLGIFISLIPEFIIKMKYGKDVWGIYAAKGSLRRDYYNTSWYLKEERYLEEIKLFGSQQHLLKRIRKLYDSFLNEQKSKEKKKFLLSLGASLIQLVTFSISLIYIFYSTLYQKITLGSLTFYNGRIMVLNDSLGSLFRNLGFNYEDMLYVDDLFKFLELTNQIKNYPKAVKVKPEAYKIEFRNVSFKYPNAKNYVLENFNLKINTKEKIALIGENGSGKTTITRLLCRFYDVNKGSILINGIDLRKIDLNSWDKCLGVLFQDFNRYAYSLKENIRLGEVDKDFEKELFNTAVSKSQVKEFVNDYEFGYKTILSKKFKKGVEPSVGQWQKIALARAFFRNAPILILDEPTSAIDAKAETVIFKQLEKFENQKTVIMISHRFSTVRNADTIYVIHKGKIIESGNHITLMKKNGRYTKLFKMQAKGYK